MSNSKLEKEFLSTQRAGTVHENFLNHLKNPYNTKKFDLVNGTAKLTGKCGDAIKIDIYVAGNKIADICQTPYGCAYTIACASTVSCLSKGLRLAQAMALQPEHVAEKLGGLPEDHMHCARLAVNVLGEAISDFLCRHPENRKGI